MLTMPATEVMLTMAPGALRASKWRTDSDDHVLPAVERLVWGAV
jgi:hypothetical protein